MLWNPPYAWPNLAMEGDTVNEGFCFGVVSMICMPVIVVSYLMMVEETEQRERRGEANIR